MSLWNAVHAFTCRAFATHFFSMLVQRSSIHWHGGDGLWAMDWTRRWERDEWLRDCSLVWFLMSLFFCSFSFDSAHAWNTINDEWLSFLSPFLLFYCSTHFPIAIALLLRGLLLSVFMGGCVRLELACLLELALRACSFFYGVLYSILRNPLFCSALFCGEGKMFDSALVSVSVSVVILWACVGRVGRNCAVAVILLSLSFTVSIAVGWLGARYEEGMKGRGFDGGGMRGRGFDGGGMVWSQVASAESIRIISMWLGDKYYSILFA